VIGLPLLCTVLVLLLLFGLSLLWLELRHRLRPASPLRLRPGSFDIRRSGDSVEVSGEITIENPHGRMEVFVPEITVDPVLLGKGSLSEVKRSVSITPLHPDEEARADGYWFAYIVKGHKRTAARVDLRFTAPPGVNVAELLDTLWLDIRWINYGPFGRLERRDGILVPLQRPQPIQPAQASWRAGEGCRVLPLRTHLLGVLDNPQEVLERYAGSLIQPGDVLTIGETPLAVIQGRYNHPSNVEPSLLARQLCRVFHPTSSLATACGLRHQGWTANGFLGDELASETHPNAALLQRNLDKIRDGEVLVMHWGVRSRREPFAGIFDALIGGLQARGFCFRPLPPHGVGWNSLRIITCALSPSSSRGRCSRHSIIWA
jgi:hypothetical protein